MEIYTIPAIVRKVLKTTKLNEVVEIKSTKKDKLTDHFDDSVFKKEWLLNFEKEVIITIALVYFE